MPFGGRGWLVGPWNHVLDGSQGRTNPFAATRGDKSVISQRVCCAKMAEPIEMPFGRLTHVGPRNHSLDGVKVGRIHSVPRGVTRWRCGLLSKFFDHLSVVDVSVCCSLQWIATVRWTTDGQKTYRKPVQIMISANILFWNLAQP